jgi:hypothetical protein
MNRKTKKNIQLFFKPLMNLIQSLLRSLVSQEKIDCLLKIRLCNEEQ